MPAMLAARAFVLDRLVRLTVGCLLGLGALTAGAQTVRKPFSALRVTGGAAAAAHALVVELSAREALSGVHLHIASDVAPEFGARYVVWVNGAQVAQADANGAAQTIALPPEAFVPGTNSVQLARVPRYATITGQAAYSEIAPINDARSSISLDFAGLRRNLSPTLAQLPLAFDARAWMPRNVTVALGRQPPSAEQLRAATLAVESIAARMRVDIAVAYEGEKAIINRGHAGSWVIDEDAARAGDLLLVGTRHALADRLPESVVKAIDGPFLGVYPANEGKAVMVVLSGVTDADCVRAAQAFADTTTALPTRSAMTLDNSATVRAPQSHLAISLAQADAALVGAALNFAAIYVRATGVLADVKFTFSADIANSDFFLGPATSLDARLARQLPVLPALQPGQAVSLTGSSRAHRFVAVLGSNDTSVARTVDLLRQPSKWSLLAQRATLFDTTTGSAKPLAVASRSPVATLRLLLADPVVFWCVLTALLALSYIVLNKALADQVKNRFDRS